MPFTYFNNIPQPTDQPSQSQPQLLQNFISIDDLIDVNHYTFAEVDAGKHRYVQMPIQAVAPATGVDEYALYTYAYSTALAQPAVTNLVLKKPSTGARIPFTSAGSNSEGWSWLASGLLMKWGVSAVPVATVNTQTLTYPTGDYPAFNAAAYCVMLTPISGNYVGIDPDFSVYLQSLGNATTFTYRLLTRYASNTAPSTSARFRWLAIGPATAYNI